MSLLVPLVFLVVFLVAGWLLAAFKRSVDDPIALIGEITPGIQERLAPYAYSWIDDGDQETSEKKMWAEIGGIGGVYRLCLHAGNLVSIALYFAKESEGHEGRRQEYESLLQRAIILRMALLGCIVESMIKAVFPAFPRIYCRLAAATYFKMCVNVQTLFEAYRPEDIEKAIQAL